MVDCALAVWLWDVVVVARRPSRHQPCDEAAVEEVEGWEEGGGVQGVEG